MPRSVRLAFETEDGVRVSPPIFLNNTIKVQPGDLSQFAPDGEGVYGLANSDKPNPFIAAPLYADRGGVLYFSSWMNEEQFMAFMHITGVQESSTVCPLKEFAVFIEHSENPGKDGYITQMRLISRFGLRFLYGALTEEEYEKFPKQAFSMAEIILRFMKDGGKKWGRTFQEDKEKGLSGMFGGDGDFAREKLCFGFMVENDYFHIYRIWSRACLVTK